MSKVRLTATIACFQIRKNGRKSLSFTVRVYLNLQLSFFYPIPRETFLYAYNKGADQPAQFYQFSLESMIAKPATCVRGSRQFQRGGGGGGGGGGRRRRVELLLEGGSYQFFF